MLIVFRQHNVVPETSMVANVTHVALAFMRSETFNTPNQTEWPLFTTIDDVRPKFTEGTIIQVAIGGWGDTEGFSTAAQTPESRKLFASNIKAMLDSTGADGDLLLPSFAYTTLTESGIDIDWEYPGGNGENYKMPGHFNVDKAWEIWAYPLLLAEIRSAVGPETTISAAVPGLSRDMLAFTPSTIPKIMESVDYLNIMTYDLMNRRDNVTKHHADAVASEKAINVYIDAGLPREKANMGLAFYIKWFKTALNSTCHIKPIGCATELMEDPFTGADLGKAGAFSWHDPVPAELSASFNKAMANGEKDYFDGGYGATYYWDKEERLFWSWESPRNTFDKIMTAVYWYHMGGVFAWGLGEDAPSFEHLNASNEAMKMAYHWPAPDPNPPADGRSVFGMSHAEDEAVLRDLEEKYREKERAGEPDGRSEL
jgi:GH18 family chitinase